MLKQKIQEDLKEALKKKETLRTSVLRMLNSAIHNREIEKKTKLRKSGEMTEEEIAKEGQLANEEVIETISSEVKKRNEAILEFSAHAGFASGGEKEKIDNFIEKEKKEKEILEKYLPEQLSEEELKKIVKEVIEKIGAKDMKDMGKVMAEIIPKVRSRADGSQVSKIVKELLT